MVRNIRYIVVGTLLAFANAACGGSSDSTGETDGETGDETGADSSASDDDDVEPDVEDEDDQPEDEPEDPCEDVTCEEGEVCEEGECVESSADPPPDDEPDDGTSGADATDYPEPDGDECPESHINGNSLVTDPANFCAPPCDDGSCPTPETGNVIPSCRLRDSVGSRDDCDEEGAECDEDGEICQMRNDALVCLPPLSHCYLICELEGVSDLECPDGMICQDYLTIGICAYE